MHEVPTKIYLSETETPKYWHNYKVLMKDPHPPMRDPNTLRPVTQADLEKVLCK